MKDKELRNLAKKIAKLEQQLATCNNPDLIPEIEDSIVKLSGKVNNIVDMVKLDELIQENLQKICIRA
jgi:hypothetical protein